MSSVRVASIFPFWRYAVGPGSSCAIAIPCYTRKGADTLFNEIITTLPWASAFIYKRTWRGLVVVCAHYPQEWPK